MSKPKKRRPQTVTMTLRKDGTISMRSTGGLDLRPFLSPATKAQLDKDKP